MAINTLCPFAVAVVIASFTLGLITWLWSIMVPSKSKKANLRIVAPCRGHLPEGKSNSFRASSTLWENAS